MRFEISVEGPPVPLGLLSERIDSQLVADTGIRLSVIRTDRATTGLIVLAEDPEKMEAALFFLSREMEALERSISMKPGDLRLHVRNLGYGEPVAGTAEDTAFRPVSFLGVRSWKGTAPLNMLPDEILLDTSNAFGSGTHPSTILCLEILGEISADSGLLGKDVLDFGCGTAIIGMAAIKLGASRVVGIEIDPDAAETARRNVSLNALGDKVEIRRGSLDAAQGFFQVIFANLVAAAHVRVAAGIAGLLSPGGIALISGFTTGQQSTVEDLYKKSGLEFAYRKERDGWQATVFRRP